MTAEQRIKWFEDLSLAWARSDLNPLEMIEALGRRGVVYVLWNNDGRTEGYCVQCSFSLHYGKGKHTDHTCSGRTDPSLREAIEALTYLVMETLNKAKSS